MLPILLLILGVAQASGHISRVPHRCSTRPAVRLCAIHAHVRHVNTVRRRIGKQPIRYQWQPERYPARRDRYLSYWTRLDRHAHKVLHAYLATPPWLSHPWVDAALCVHHYEGAWNANTGNGYYGGMQFDLSTWAANGGTGRPDLNPPAEQLRVAYRTWQARGWTPWPNTAAMCGLV